MLKWLLPLTSMKLFTLSSFFNAPAAVIFLFSSSSAPLRIDWLPWHLVGSGLLNWSKTLSKLIQFTNHHFLVDVTGKRVNRGFGSGFKIQVNYFLWRCKSSNMDENILEKLDNELPRKIPTPPTPFLFPIGNNLYILCLFPTNQPN